MDIATRPEDGKPQGGSSIPERGERHFFVFKSADRARGSSNLLFRRCRALFTKR